MKKVIIWAIILSWGVFVHADTHYVVPPGGGANPTPDYTTWATATTSIIDAVGASANGDTVMVSNGVYMLTNQVSITKGITLKSFSGSWTNTFINGNNYVGKLVTNRCIYMNHADALVEGFTITNGYIKSTGSVDGGGGVFMYAGTLRNCLITGNQVTNGSGTPGGAGVYAVGINCMITNCDIIANTGYRTLGGGVLLDKQAQLWNCRIMFNSLQASNTTPYLGVGLHINRGAFYGTLACNSQIISNSGVTTIGMGAGGGVAMQYGAILRNCLIMGNSVTTPGHASEFGGGLSVRSYSNEVDNCTIVGNSAQTGGGIFLNQTTTNTTLILNTIIYSNVIVNIYQNACKGLFVNSCTSSTNGLEGSGNFTNWPALENYAGGNYRLAPDSPCINQGLNRSWMDGARDLDNHSRRDRFSDMVDMGCYEYLPQGMMFKAR